MSVIGDSEPVQALSDLLRAEKLYSTREKLSTVSWFKDVWRIRASAIVRVWKAVIWITAWSIIVGVLDILYDKQLGLTNNVVPLMTVVIGLLLVFRNTAAFNRWEEGRKTFAAMTNTTRTLARYIWLNVGLALEHEVEEGQNPYRHSKWTEQDQKEKRSMLRLAVAFAIASKHHVRNEFGVDYDDYKGLFSKDFLKVVGDGYNTKQNGYGTITGQVPISSPGVPSDNEAAEDSRVWIRNDLERPSIPLPLAILHYMQMQMAKFRAKGYFDAVGPASYNFSSGLLNALNDELGTVERLSRTPIPTIYGVVHLKQSVTVYLTILPLCLVDQMSWKMVPFVTAFSFVLLGIEGIAAECEIPFGFDPSDIPLDLMCAELKNEILHVMSRFPDTPWKDKQE